MAIKQMEELHEAKTRCSQYLNETGQPSPRTCQQCGLGPCRFYSKETKQENQLPECKNIHEAMQTLMNLYDLSLFINKDLNEVLTNGGSITVARINELVASMNKSKSVLETMIKLREG